MDEQRKALAVNQKVAETIGFQVMQIITLQRDLADAQAQLAALREKVAEVPPA